MLHEKWASGIEHKLVGIKHLPTVCLKLNVAQVWVVDHGTEVGHQQTKGKLKRDGGEWPLPPWPPNHAGAQQTGRRRPVRASCCSPQGLTLGSTLKLPSGPQRQGTARPSPFSSSLSHPIPGLDRRPGPWRQRPGAWRGMGDGLTGRGGGVSSC